MRNMARNAHPQTAPARGSLLRFHDVVLVQLSGVNQNELSLVGRRHAIDARPLQRGFRSGNCASIVTSYS